MGKFVLNLLSVYLLALSCQMRSFPARVAFDIRNHLSTKNRYAFRLSIPNAPSIYDYPDPDGYKPLYLWLISRHGTRWPTKGRMSEINTLERLFMDASNVEKYPWLEMWQSPTKGMDIASGELHDVGNEEMWSLAWRLRKRFPTIVAQQYFPKRYSIVSSQVSRAAASAAAFASGFFPPISQPDFADCSTASLGAAVLKEDALCRDRQLKGEGPILTRPQAVAITMSPKDADPLLRFFDICPAYEAQEKRTGAILDPWMEANWSLLAPKLEQRLGMNRTLSASEVEALWQLCLWEAGVQNQTSQACQLFLPSEVSLLEWMDDVDLLENHGYGASINYQMAAPLLGDLVASLQDVANQKSPWERARLLFGHCETLIPLASLMGLFNQLQEDYRSNGEASLSLTESTSLQSDYVFNDDSALHDAYHYNLKLRLKSSRTSTLWQPTIPLRLDRMWRGSRIAPYGSNMFLVLYRKQTSGSSTGPQHLVRLVYNEQVIPIPKCGGVLLDDGVFSSNVDHAKMSVEMGSLGMDCDLEKFLDLYQSMAADPQSLDRICALHSTVATS
ncbi:hypothetical protein CEUSTIGMA_g10112.t1 [Chlamydomonas eustigma]|uniref:Multiple inositol polyphosphate phosphatase 1 n=1 Tax=Chlamydomonas eustigma TaxID=1157962 RepID=A0A250XI54_9CHLO|nr:hypothetical protein CEUSTIGMA_g10112.t1 [Chlamydomonas eustigma]|eukprot:GAX82686.1 hypothetical protein CEUSTIGMA_g10112.t1 [Chlamydomonas eustigma]